MSAIITTALNHTAHAANHLMVNPPAGDYGACTVVQGQKHLSDQISCNKKIKLIQSLESEYKSITLTPPRNRQQQQEWLALAAQRLQANGTLITAQDNKAGAKSLQKDVEALFADVSVETRQKGRLIIAKQPKKQEAASLQTNILRPIKGINALSAPGLFAWDRMDRGSDLLCDHLPAACTGIGADIGCGWGALSRFIIDRYEIDRLYALDNDWLAIEAVTANIKDPRITPLWADATQPIPNIPPLDWVIMNPPFHEGQKADNPDLGIAIITQTAKALKKKGQLWMVANAHLPYEATLAANFKTVTKLTEMNGFKIFKAER